VSCLGELSDRMKQLRNNESISKFRKSDFQIQIWVYFLTVLLGTNRKAVLPKLSFSMGDN
jgi:hypothetical protein